MGPIIGAFYHAGNKGLPKVIILHFANPIFNRFKAYTDSTYVYEPVKPGEFQTIMPWIMYGGMSEEDLGAIYTYLRSVPPVENLVERFTFASK